MASSGLIGEILRRTSYSGLWVKKIYFTFIEEELLLAMNADPKHIASSPLRWTDKSFLCRYSSRISVTFGTLVPPPINSIWLMSSILRPDFSRASSIGFDTWAKKSLAYSSTSSLGKLI